MWHFAFASVFVVLLLHILVVWEEDINNFFLWSIEHFFPFQVRTERFRCGCLYTVGCDCLWQWEEIEIGILKAIRA